MRPIADLAEYIVSETEQEEELKGAEWQLHVGRYDKTRIFGGGHNSRLLRLQSAHILLHSIFSRFLMTCWFCAAWEGVARRDMTAGSAVLSMAVRDGSNGCCCIWGIQ
jgi:hypothetical protein